MRSGQRATSGAGFDHADGLDQHCVDLAVRQARVGLLTQDTELSRSGVKRLPPSHIVSYTHDGPAAESPAPGCCPPKARSTRRGGATAQPFTAVLL